MAIFGEQFYKNMVKKKVWKKIEARPIGSCTENTGTIVLNYDKKVVNKRPK